MAQKYFWKIIRDVLSLHDDFSEIIDYRILYLFQAYSLPLQTDEILHPQIIHGKKQLYFNPSVLFSPWKTRLRWSVLPRATPLYLSIYRGNERFDGVVPASTHPPPIPTPTPRPPLDAAGCLREKRGTPYICGLRQCF